MARYEHLPLYKTAMELTVYIETVVRSFSRYHKYTLGTDLRQQSRALVTVIIRANSRGEKLPVLAGSARAGGGLSGAACASARR